MFIILIVKVRTKLHEYASSLMTEGSTSRLKGLKVGKTLLFLRAKRSKTGFSKCFEVDVSNWKSRRLCQCRGRKAPHPRGVLFEKSKMDTER